MKDRKGFTLIEIVSVIIILGIIMIIAVPSVTSQILLSRKSVYATNVKSLLETVDGSYRELEYGEYLEEKELILIPISAIDIADEKLIKSPFADYDKSRSYIVIKPTKNNFVSYAFIRDVADYGVFALPYDEINKKTIQATDSSSIIAIDNYYTCIDGNVVLETNNSFSFMGKEYYPTDFVLKKSNKCDEKSIPVIKFSNLELSDGELYTIYFDNNTGEGEMESITCEYGRECTLSENKFTKLGYHFNKWTKVKNGKGVSYTDKQVVKNITFLDHLTLFAQWKANSSTLIIDANGGTGGGTLTQNYNVTQTISVARSSYKFTGWEELGVCGSYENLETTSYTFPPDDGTTCTLKANWERREGNLTDGFVVTLDMQGGTGGSESVIAMYGQAMPIAIPPVKPGYSFEGYYTKVNGKGTQYYNAFMESVRNWNQKKDLTLYAKWKQVDEVTVTLGSKSLTIYPAVRAHCGGKNCTSEAGSTKVKVSSNVTNGTYSFSSDPDILKFSYDGKKITVTQKTYGGTEKRTANITITFTPYDPSFPSVSKEIPVTIHYKKEGPINFIGGGSPCDQIHSTTCRACKIVTTGGVRWATTTCD